MRDENGGRPAEMLRTCRVTSKTLTTALVLFSKTLMMASSLHKG